MGGWEWYGAGNDISLFLTFNIILFYIISEIFSLKTVVFTKLEPFLRSTPQNSGKSLIFEKKIQMAIKMVLEMFS